MAEEKKPASTLALWLEDALPGWTFPVVGIMAALGVFLLYVLDVLGERPVTTALGAVFAAGLGFALNRPGQAYAYPWAKPVVWAATAASILLVVYGVVLGAYPGQASARSSLAEAGKTMALPGPGAYRLYVSGHLSGRSETRGTYTLSVSGTGDVVGGLDRSMMRRTFRRGGGVSVAREHNVEVHDVVAAAPAEVKLAQKSPEIEGELAVEAHATLPPWALYAAIALALALTAVVDVAAAARGRAALVGGAAGTFLLMMRSVTPDRAAGPTFGAVLLGIAAGAAVGAITPRVARAILPSPEGKPGKDRGRDNRRG